MKAIQQIIDYLEGKNLLTPQQIEELTVKGYRHQYMPEELRSLEKRIGESFSFQVTGNTHGPLWGTDIYTSDSNLGTACVHAGLLGIGETGVIKVTIVKPLARFPGSVRNRVTSNLWDQAWSGAYTVALFAKTSPPEAGNGG